MEKKSLFCTFFYKGDLMKIGLAENILIGISEDMVLKTHKITI